MVASCAELVCSAADNDALVLEFVDSNVDATATHRLNVQDRVQPPRQHQHDAVAVGIRGRARDSARQHLPDFARFVSNARLAMRHFLAARDRDAANAKERDEQELPEQDCIPTSRTCAGLAIAIDHRSNDSQ